MFDKLTIHNLEIASLISKQNNNLKKSYRNEFLIRNQCKSATKTNGKNTIHKFFRKTVAYVNYKT